MGLRLREQNVGAAVPKKGGDVTFHLVSLISCRVIRTYVSLLSLSAVSSHDDCTITHS